MILKVTGTPLLRHLCIWGNHSTTQYPDISHTTVAGKAALDIVDRDWYRDEYIPRVAKRGAEIIAARGASSAASAANAALEHMHDWVLGSAKSNWVSMAVPSDGSYEIPEGLVYSFPVTCVDGDYEIVQDLAIDEFSRSMMSTTQQELEEECDMVKHLFA